jgi:hypothetical protein
MGCLACWQKARAVTPMRSPALSVRWAILDILRHPDADEVRGKLRLPAGCSTDP